ncbi:MAG: hypothetical protein ACK4NY_12580 [Spirosomataceae bacterium]
MTTIQDMKKLSVLFSIGVVFALSSCKYQNSNRIGQKDVREGDPYIYGVHPDSSAAQLKNKYPADAKIEAKAAEIRQKWFGKGNSTGA